MVRRDKLTSIGAAIIAALFLSISTASAATPAANDITDRFTAAGVNTDGFRAVEVAGIVVLRGITADKATAEQAVLVAQKLGYSRVANLIQVIEPPDDQAIQRLAERELSRHRGLDGCRFRVGSESGVIHLAGTVNSESQKDAALEIVRRIDGVRGVRIELQR